MVCKRKRSVLQTKYRPLFPKIQTKYTPIFSIVSKSTDHHYFCVYTLIKVWSRSRVCNSDMKNRHQHTNISYIPKVSKYIKHVILIFHPSNKHIKHRDCDLFSIFHTFRIHLCRPCFDLKQCFNFDGSGDTKMILVCIFGKYWKNWSVFGLYFGKKWSVFGL